MARKAGYWAEGEGDSKGGTSSKGDSKGGYLAEREPGSKGDSKGDGKAGFPSPPVGQHGQRQGPLGQIPLALEGSGGTSGKGDTAPTLVPRLMPQLIPPVGYFKGYTAGYGAGYTAGYDNGYANGYKFCEGEGGTK
jgi:hypothetical protein